MNQGSIGSPEGMLRDYDENEVEKRLCEWAGAKVRSMFDQWLCKSSERQQGVNCSYKMQVAGTVDTERVSGPAVS